MSTTLEVPAAPPVPCPEPGIYKGVPAREYHAWPAASNSRLTTMRRSPLHLRHEMDNPTQPTDAQVVGDALHTLVLQPHLFDDLYRVAGPCSGTTGKGSACTNNGKVFRGGEWWCGTHDPEKHAPTTEAPPFSLLSRDQHRIVTGMRAAILGHPRARAVVELAEDVEVSAVWDSRPGEADQQRAPVRCKLRADIFAPGLGLGADLKTTTDASREGFAKSVAAYGYHRQAAHYLSGLAALGVKMTDFSFIAVEKEPPHAVAVYRLDEAAIETGRVQLATLLHTYAWCQATNTWPGYGDHVQDLALPKWALNDI